MCGRYTIRHPQRLDPALFGVDVIPMDAPRYNIAPGQEVLVIRSVRGARAARLATWGLVPSWATDPAIGHKLANARGETLADKPSFRDAWRARRALLPADGYFEWQVIAGAKQKQPWLITLEDDEPFALGGLWESWRSPEGVTRLTTTVITTDANDATAHIHDRMPVIVPRASWGAWLRDEGDVPPAALITPYVATPMRTVRVSTWVNVTAHDDVKCVEPLAVDGDA